MEWSEGGTGGWSICRGIKEGPGGQGESLASVRHSSCSGGGGALGGGRDGV